MYNGEHNTQYSESVAWLYVNMYYNSLLTFISTIISVMVKYLMATFTWC